MGASAQVLGDYATTGDQATVSSVFDAAGAAAPGGSSLEADYNRLFVGTAADIAQSEQSMLPTTAHNVPGVVETLAGTEEKNLMSRMRSLRERDERPATTHIVYDPPFKPLQKSPEALHDLRSQADSTPTTTETKMATKRYLLRSPALYREGEPELAEHSTSVVQRTYDKSMHHASAAAGQANDQRRETYYGGRDFPKQQVTPNAVDRNAQRLLRWSGETGGAAHAYDTATDKLPRRRLVTLSEKEQKAISSYPGQPLASQLNYNDRAQPSQTPVPLSTTPPVIYGAGEEPKDIALPPPVSAPSPVIYGAGEEPVVAPPAPSAPVETPFIYRKIDQTKTLTTPRLGSVTSRSLTGQNSMVIPQTTNPALTMTSYHPPRAEQDAGTLLWQNDAGSPALLPAAPPSQATTAPAPVLPKPQANVYGTQAVPVAERSGSDSKWGVFVSGDTGFGSGEHQTNSADAKTTKTGLTVGADYKLRDKTYIGGAVTYARGSFTTGSMGDLKNDSVALSVYGTTAYARDAYVDGYLSAGYHSLNSERLIYAGNNTTRKAKASPDGYQLGGNVETGYDFRVLERTKVTPYTGFRLAYGDFGSFDETGAGNFNLKTDDMDNLSAIGSLGVGVSHAFIMNNVGTIQPGMRVAYRHEFGDDRTSVKSSFVNLANSSFTTKGAKKSRDWIALAPSVSAYLDNDWSFSLQYEHDFMRDDTNENIFNMSAHYQL
jgi:uncharacterized protein YhjY with autotransporter beta-barrel domain